MSTTSLILASKSLSRRQILENAGVPFSWCDAGIDEDALKFSWSQTGDDPASLALCLAKAKAGVVSVVSDNPPLVLGCDQILVQGGKLYDKPETMAEARTHLESFSGRTHQLIAAVCMMQSGNVVWSHVDHAEMYVRDLSDSFIDAYLDTEGERILSSVGAYLLEGTGAQLFERVRGDYFTVLGLPLLPLLEELRKRGILAS
mgnify:CR=1 FL=1